MTTLRIGNNFADDIVGDLTRLSPLGRRLAGCGAQRLAWFARDGDVLVLPWTPPEEYLRYVTGLTGTNRDSLRLLAPAAGHAGVDVLSTDRLTDPRLHEAVRDALAGRAIDRIEAFCPNAGVAELARSLGRPDAMPGYGFARQGGTTMANSKAAFRAVAAGVGVPIADGTTAASPADAERAITGMLTAGHCVILKQDLQLGGSGNEILSGGDGVRPAGARRVVVLPDRGAIGRYLAERWDWLTARGRHRLVVERYHPGSVAVYAEFTLTDNGIDLTGTGEMTMAPTVVGEIVPAPSLTPAERETLVDAGRRLCEPYLAMGYRGTISADAFVTPDGRTMFSEVNARTTGSTHIHVAIGARVAGDGDRVLLERSGRPARSFAAASERLAAAGLAYDPVTRTGVVIICDFTAVNGTVRCCVVAPDMAGAREYERRLAEVLTNEEAGAGAQ